ncbi:DUF3310 domain-containing protein [Turicimonas muris]|uniref:DUF3310 domain-containing protein n=1 Tax=Turicimonas muris TaxID=1796652 RepID=UPI001C3EDB18|nr:DUF3310 domain-containing protein [Turicimonas muris]
MSTDIVNHPAHYESQAIVIQPIDLYEKLPFCLGNALKYVFRAGHKDGSSELEDLKKALWYLERYKKSSGALAMDEYEGQSFYQLAYCLEFSKSEILSAARDLATGFYMFWDCLEEKVRQRIEKLEREKK